MARATAPKFSGFLVPTSTTRKFSIPLLILGSFSLRLCVVFAPSELLKLQTYN